MNLSRLPRHKVFLGSLFLTTLGVLVWLLVDGWSYYTTPLVERPRHPDFWRLKPGGTLGNLFGILGTALMVVMHLYSLRKRTGVFGRRGMLSVWLACHIFCGVVGPLLIILHSSFKLTGIVGMTFWMMVAVAFSGVLGRYLYRQIPRARTGAELSLRDAEKAEKEIADELTEAGVSAQSLEQLEALAKEVPPADTGLARLLLRLPFDDLRLRWRLRAFRRELHDVAPQLRKRTLRLARRKVTLSRRILLWRRLQQLFFYWHVVHKPFAVVMYLFVFLHVAISVMTGYGWVG